MSRFLRFAVAGTLLLLLGLGVALAQEVVFSSGPSVTPLNGASNGGFAWGDMNGDGTPDVWIPPNNVLYNFNTFFAPAAATKTQLLSTNVNSVGGLVADINGDGVLDIWSTNNAAPQTGLFYDSLGVQVAPSPAGQLAQAGPTGSVFAGMAVADIDHSNYLSAAWQGFLTGGTWGDNTIFPPTYNGIELLKGGPTGFTRVGKGAAAGQLAIDTTHFFEAWDVKFFDANNDGWADLFMPSFRHGFQQYRQGSDTVGARKGCILFVNDKTGKFIVPSSASVGRTIYSIDSVVAGHIYATTKADTGVVVDDTVRHFNAIGSQWGDLNNDGFPDLLLTGTEVKNTDGFGVSQQIVVIYGKGDGTFTYKWNGTNVVNSGLPLSGSIRAWDIGDYNNDGIPDVYASTTFGTTRLFRGNGDGTFTEVTNQDNVQTAGGGRAGGFVDYNSDGFLDIYNYTGLNSVLQKNGGNSNHWIGFTAVGTGHNKSAIGARFAVYTQDGTYKQYRWIKAEGNAAGHGEMRALFGIGINTAIDSVVVRWPDGTTGSYAGLKVDQYWTVNEGSAIPGAPTLATPADNATGVAQSGTLTWTAGSSALKYNVQVSLDPAFANKRLLAVNDTVTGTSDAYILGAATKYYWRVAGVNGGFGSAYSAVRSFTTSGSAAAQVPVFVSPANKALKNTINNYNGAPVLRFTLPAGKTLANYGRFTFKGYFAQGDVGYKDIVVEAYQTMPTAQFANVATNKIGSVNRAQLGSTGWENIAVSIPNASTIHDSVFIAFGINCAGTGNVGGTGVATVWYADNAALVDTTAAPGPSIVNGFDDKPIGTPVGHIGWAAGDVQSVIAKDPTGTGVSLQPANLTLAVNKTSDASRYQWQVSTLPSFVTFFVNDSTADTTYSTVFTGGQTFYARVRGMNDLGRSAFSAIDTFTIVTPPGKTTLVSPAANALNVITDSVVFVWRPVAGAVTYNLALSTVNGTVTYNGLTDTTLKVRNLVRLTNYTWKVEAINAGGTSTYTAANSFTTVVANPGVPTAGVPASAAINVARLARFTWSPVLNAAKYELQLATDNAFAAVVRDTVVFDTVAVLQNPLDATTDYYWHIRSINLGGSSAYSTGRLFTTGTLLSVEGQNGPPVAFRLDQNYPNPFNPATTISFDVPKSAHVNIVIYDVLGRTVTTLVDEVKAANRYRVTWNATNVATGVYFYRLTARSVDGSGTFTAVKKLLLMK